MRIAKRPPRRPRVSFGSAARRHGSRVARQSADQADRRLFLQLSSSAVIVAMAVMVSGIGGSVRDGMVETLERTTGLEEVNAALTELMEDVPVLGRIFSEEGAVQVFGEENLPEEGAAAEESEGTYSLEPLPAESNGSGPHGEAEEGASQTTSAADEFAGGPLP
ncbi:MAG: hypothetical protein IJF59_03870, partial [Clostridia bacterium]|nr:hypothetical protein [Clostridia bacterium]